MKAIAGRGNGRGHWAGSSRAASLSDRRPAEIDTTLTQFWGVDFDQSELGVGEYLDRWLDDHARLKVKPSTLLRYRQLAGRLKPLIGEVSLQDLCPAHIQSSYATLLSSGLAAQTVVHHHRMLRQALDHAMRWGLLAANPTDAVSTPLVERREMRTLSARDVALLEEAAGDTEFRRLIHVAVTTGLRLGELLGLQWNDIDFDRARLRVQRTVVHRERKTSLGSPKTPHSIRAVALSRRTIATLREQQDMQAVRRARQGRADADARIVFPAEDGSLQPPYRVSNRFTSLVRRVGLTGVRFHDLRHTMATLALAAGVHIKVVSERLGHSNTQITLDTYSHVLPDLQREAAEALDAALTLG